jgi:hypothetical protein
MTLTDKLKIVAKQRAELIGEEFTYVGYKELQDNKYQILHAADGSTDDTSGPCAFILTDVDLECAEPIDFPEVELVTVPVDATCVVEAARVDLLVDDSFNTNRFDGMQGVLSVAVGRR